jgi:hypothetical protein
MCSQQQQTQSNTSSALILVRFLNCLGKAAVGIVYYVDCTVKDELFRRKDARQSLATNKKVQQKTTKSTKKRTKRKTPDEDDDNQTSSINDMTSASSNMTVNERVSFDCSSSRFALSS